MEAGKGITIGSQAQNLTPSNIVEIRPGVSREARVQNDVEIEAGQETEIEVLDRVEEKIDEAENVIFAQDLFEKAKNEGEDAAFEMMAADEEVEAAEITEAEDKKIKEENSEVSAVMQERVNTLETKVDGLIAENRELREKVNEMQAVQAEAILGAYELAVLLKKLIEENEELKKKNKGILELLANLIAKIITLMVVDDDKAREKEEEKPILENKAA